MMGKRGESERNTLLGCDELQARHSPKSSGNGIGEPDVVCWFEKKAGRDRNSRKFAFFQLELPFHENSVAGANEGTCILQ